MRFFKSKKEKGQSMVEMLVAITIIVGSILGIIVLVNRAIALNRIIFDQYVATYLAAEGMEVAKNLFDRKYLEMKVEYPLAKNFYGWTGQPKVPSIFPSGIPQQGGSLVFTADFQSTRLKPVSCVFPPGPPTEDQIRNYMFTCKDTSIKLYANDSNIYVHDVTNKETPFKRIIVIDFPQIYQLSNCPGDPCELLDYRVTSAVGLESRRGRFVVVQLQDHFLPWRIP